MLFGEPARTPYDLNFSLFGVPVRIHPMFWLIALLTTCQEKAIVAIFTWIMAVFLAILLHELGHALVLKKFGHRPWIILYALGGLTAHDPRDSRRFGKHDSLEQIVVSAAGPVAGFLGAACLVLALFAAGRGEELLFGDPWGLLPRLKLHFPISWFDVFLNDVFYVSIFWGLINLLPIYPLDGGQIAREIFLKVRLRGGIRESLLLSLVAAVAMALYGLKQQNYFVAVLFASLAYGNYSALQSWNGMDR